MNCCVIQRPRNGKSPGIMETSSYCKESGVEEKRRIAEHEELMCSTTFQNLLISYTKHDLHDLADDVLAEKAHLHE